MKNIKIIEMVKRWRKIQYYFSIYLIFIGSSTSFAQVDTTEKMGKNESIITNQTEIVHLKLLARSYGDSVVLRWTMNNPTQWEYIFQQGFVIERLEVDDATNQPISGKFLPISAQPILPESKASLQDRISRKDTSAALAYSCLYQEIIDTSKGDYTNEDFFARINQQNLAHKNRFMMANLLACMSPSTANALGLRYVDKNVDKAKKYFYRLRIASENLPSNWAIDTSFSFVKPAHKFNLSQPEVPEPFGRDSLVSLRWNISQDYFAWNVYRSSDNAHFDLLTSSPYFQIYTGAESNQDEVIYTNKIPENYKPFWYKIQGVDIFGDWSPLSVAVKTNGVDLTPPPAPVLLEVLNPKTTAISLKWFVPDESQINSQMILRSEEYSGPYDTLAVLGKNIREYLDQDIQDHGTYFYMVASLDLEGNSSHCIPQYAQMLDREPPSKPTGLKGEIDSSGVVRLVWNQNQDKDIQGYNVFVANYKDDTYVPISNMIEDTTFMDTISLLTTLKKDIYYQVRAIDYSYKVSEYSDILTLKKPDLVAPVAPVFNNYGVSDTSIYLFWNYSTSDDVIQHLLYRKHENDAWQLYKEFGQTDSSFLDLAVVPNEYYEYKILAKDDAGLVSDPSQILRLKPYESERNKIISGISVLYDAQNKSIKLSWNYSLPITNTKFLIWKSTEDENLAKYELTDVQQNTYFDSQFASGKKYNYAIQSIELNGNKSNVSTPVSIKIE